MSEKMLVLDAISELKKLEEETKRKINEMKLSGIKKCGESNVLCDGTELAGLKERTEREYQEIMDMIAKCRGIRRALTAFEANTNIQTSYGEYSIAEARKIMEWNRNGEGECELYHTFIQKLNMEIVGYNIKVREINDRLKEVGNKILESGLKRLETVKDPDPNDQSFEFSYYEQNKVEVALDLNPMLGELIHRKHSLIKEIGYKIQIAEATMNVEL